jgi:Na+/proline symporter
MKKSNYLIWLGISAVAGTAIGLLSERRNTAKGGLLGATAGIAAGAIAVGVYEYVSSKERFPYYSEVSPLYEELQ